MALKNLYDMVKADRYTQDGREELIKAQEAETEDKVYQIGEISQKTGLQKTANGWVKPKSGKQPGAASKHDTDPQTYIVKKNDELRKMYLNEKDPAKKEAMKKALKKQASMMEPEPFSSTESKPALSQTDGKGNKVEIKITESKGGGFYVDKYVNGKKVGINNANTRESAEAKAKSMMEQHMADPDYKAESKPAAQKKSQSVKSVKEYLTNNFWSQPEDFKNEMSDAGWDVDEMTNEYAVISNDAGSQYEVRFADHGDGRDLTMKSFKALQIDEDDDDSLEDGAPSLSEIVDRVYNIGEISEKTGLQKTANGWRPVKKGTAPAKKQEKKGAGIPQATTETFVGKTYKDFVESATPSGYKPTKNTDNPDGSSTTVFEKEGKQLKVDFDKSGKITSVQEISKPSESKPAADFTKYKRDTGLNLYGKSAQEGEQYMKENGFELQPESRPDRKIYKNGFGEKYEASYTPEGVFNGGSHSYAPIPGRDNHRAYQEGMGNKYLGQKKREDGTVTQVYLTPEGKYERSDFTAKGEYNGGSTSSEEFYKKWYNDDLEDAAPRVLTGDCRIRIRKEKPALTGDTKIRVRK